MVRLFNSTKLVLLVLLFFSSTIIFAQNYKIDVDPQYSSGSVDFSGCSAEAGAVFTATVTNPQGDPIANIDLDVKVTGVHSINDEVTTDLNGEAIFSYTGFYDGYDKITFKIGNKKKKAYRYWKPCPLDDDDCDGVINQDDVCDGGDDSVDLNGDGLPDCNNYPGDDYFPDEWTCHYNKYIMCIPLWYGCQEYVTACVPGYYVGWALYFGAYFGPCDSSNCDENSPFSTQHNFTNIQAFNNAENEDFYISAEGDLMMVDELYGNLKRTRDLVAFPNPAKDIVHFGLPIDIEKVFVSARLFTTDQKEVWTGSLDDITNGLQLQKLGLAEGMYILYIQTTFGRYVSQFVIIK